MRTEFKQISATRFFIYQQLWIIVPLALSFCIFGSSVSERVKAYPGAGYLAVGFFLGLFVAGLSVAISEDRERKG
ncbi:hypothetical protein [Sphingomonas sp. GB1N7]|uniref:hypothetical protein n=1 Tax=Parasphingomonas caseinilytica TaxID=3096158 RepID=UPI002FC73B56